MLQLEFEDNPLNIVVFLKHGFLVLRFLQN